MKAVFEKIIERLEKELKLSDKEKERCVRENPLQFDSAKGYASGVSNAIEIINQVAEEYATDINVGNKDSIKVNQEPKTRIECLRSMSVEELADKILSFDELSISLGFCQNFSECEKKWNEGDAIPDEMCKKCLIQWLNSPE